MKIFHVTFVLSVCLIVGGFFCPPIGVIDGSVLTAVGLLMMFGLLAQLPTILDAVQKGKSIRLQKGDVSVDIHSTGSAELSSTGDRPE